RPAPVLAQVGTGARAVTLAVRGRIEFGLERLRVHRQPRREPQRTRVDTRGDLPPELAEAFADLVVQVQGVGNEEADPQPDQRQRPGDQPATPVAAGRAGAAVVVLVFVVLDARHGLLGPAPAGCRGCENVAPSSLAQGPIRTVAPVIDRSDCQERIADRASPRVVPPAPPRLAPPSNADRLAGTRLERPVAPRGRQTIR